MANEEVVCVEAGVLWCGGSGPLGSNGGRGMQGDESFFCFWGVDKKFLFRRFRRDRKRTEKGPRSRREKGSRSVSTEATDFISSSFFRASSTWSTTCFVNHSLPVYVYVYIYTFIHIYICIYRYR